MDRYSRLYRDPKSPLSPLTPLGECAFNFDFGGDNSLCQHIDEALRTPRESPKPPAKFSNEFQKRRQVFEANQKKLDREQVQNLDLQLKRLHLKSKASPQQQHVQQRPTTAKQQHRQRHHQTQRSNEATTPKSIYLEVPQAAYVVRHAQHDAQQQHKQSERFHAVSPVKPKLLSPRLASLLTRHDMWKYGSLFQREEIDWDVFQSLNPRDLLELGIRVASDRDKIMDAVRTARKFIKAAGLEG